MKVPIIKVKDSATIPKYHSPGAAAFDISAAETVTIEPGKLAKIPTGLVFQTPPGHFLLMAARSSLAVKKGLMLGNSIGIVDSDFSGPEDELHVLVFNITQEPVTVTTGERITQGIFFPIERVEWVSGEHADNASRGGFGHSGGYAENS